MSFLDDIGVQYLWDKIKATFGKKKNAIYYIQGTGTTAGTWLGTCEDITEYYDGLTIAYKIPIAGASTTTLNINGLGAITVCRNYSESIGTIYRANSVVILVYSTRSDGVGTWQFSEFYVYQANQLRKSSGGYQAKTILYRYQLLLTCRDGTLLPINTVNNSTATTKTLTTESFDPFGTFYYYDSTSTVNASADIPASCLNSFMRFDLRYSFNTGTTLTANKPVYMVCELQSDGLMKLSSSPISQELPTSQDGLYYIYLGQSYSTYQIELDINHPIYYYIDGAVRVYSGQDVDSALSSTSSNPVQNKVIKSALDKKMDALSDGAIYNYSGTQYGDCVTINSSTYSMQIGESGFTVDDDLPETDPINILQVNDSTFTYKGLQVVHEDNLSLMPMYQHNITIQAMTVSGSAPDTMITFSFVNNVSTAYTAVRGGIDTALYNAGFNLSTKLCSASGASCLASSSSASGLPVVIGVYCSSPTTGITTVLFERIYGSGTYTMSIVTKTIGMYSQNISDVVTYIGDKVAIE